MKLLVGVNNNLNEWNDACGEKPDRPRLPLPYAFGAAFYKRNHDLAGINFGKKNVAQHADTPFKSLYGGHQLWTAVNASDFSLLWGGRAVNILLKSFVRDSNLRSKIILCSYMWRSKKFPNARTGLSSCSLRTLSRFSRALVLMTHQQVQEARTELPHGFPIVRFRCGIDKNFYKSQSLHSDIPERHKQRVDELLLKPFVILPGDEQRMDDDAVKFVKQTGIPLVRICQYYHPQRMAVLKDKVKSQNIENLFYIFEGIEYSFLRFLLQHAAVYAGFVDSSWQPAGWTVACEALASGLPSVIYEGIVSKELSNLGAKNNYFLSVNSKSSFDGIIEKIAGFVNMPDRSVAKDAAQDFIEKNLDIEKTGADFIQQIERLAEEKFT